MIDWIRSFGHALSGVRIQRVQRGRLTGLRPEGCGRLTAAGCVEGLWKKVLRIDGPFRAQGFLSLTALRAEGCGLPLCGNAYKVSVTGLAVCVICDTISSATYFLVSP